MNLAALMIRAARARPDSLALARGLEPHSDYRALADRSAAIAGSLRAAGLQPGDRVAIAMKNCPEFIELLYGIWHAGLCAVPVNARLHPAEFAYIFENSGARVVAVTPDLADALAPVCDGLPEVERMLVVGEAEFRALYEGERIGLADVAPTDNAWLFYTSGTTGRPKGAALSHRNLMHCTLGYFSDVDDISEGDAVLHPAPLSHASGCYSIPYVVRASPQVVPHGGFDPEEIFELIRHYRGSSFFAAPTMVKRLIDHPAAASADVANLRSIIYGGGPMYVADAKRAFELWGPKLIQIYGQGECPMTITSLRREEIADVDHPRYEERLASTGRAFSNVEVRVADEDERALPAGEIGEIQVRGEVVMNGYWNNPEATEAALRGGWLHTGDVGIIDEEGYVTLKDRSKDMIISGGTNIYPREIEEVLLTHSGVSEVAVIGRPDPEWGESVIAYVVAAGDTPAQDSLDRHCLDHMARFKRPKAYRFVEALPKNNYGKVVKTEIRDLEAAQPAP